MLPCSPMLLQSKQRTTFITANLYLRWLDGGVRILSKASRSTDVHARSGCHAGGKNICVHSVRCGPDNSKFTGHNAPVNCAQNIRDACPSPFSAMRRTDLVELRKIRTRRVVSRGPGDRLPGEGAEARPLALPLSRSRQGMKESPFIKVDGFLPVNVSPPRSLQPQRALATRAPWSMTKGHLESSPMPRFLDARAPRDASLCRRSGCLAPRPREANDPPSPRACLLLSPWNTRRFVPQSPSQFIHQAESFLVDMKELERSPSAAALCRKHYEGRIHHG
nr:uncharacterized protein LOC113819344 [Penaeus vannamei]